MSELSVNISKTINAPIDSVFDAWLDPAILTHFILPMSGMPKPHVTNQANVGGKFEIIMHVGENKVPHTGEYLSIDRPNTLSFTWNSPASSDDSVVTINFVAINDHKTEIELTHVKFIDEQRRADHEGGWKNILTTLEKVLAH